MRPVRTWSLVLRCFSCRRTFTFRYLEVDRILVMSEVAPCPFCGTRPAAQSGGNKRTTFVSHEMYNLAEETDVVFRKTRAGDTWHFSSDCSHWPQDDYIVLEAPPQVGAYCNECEVRQAVAEN